MNIEEHRRAKRMVDAEVILCISPLVRAMDDPKTGMRDSANWETILSDISGHYDPEFPDPEDPNFIEALEHWAVSDWLAERLAEKGEAVSRDFYGLNVWGRTCSGQAIALDSVILEILRERESA